MWMKKLKLINNERLLKRKAPAKACFMQADRDWLPL